MMRIHGWKRQENLTVTLGTCCDANRATATLHFGLRYGPSSTELRYKVIRKGSIEANCDHGVGARLVAVYTFQLSQAWCAARAEQEVEQCIRVDLYMGS